MSEVPEASEARPATRSLKPLRALVPFIAPYRGTVLVALLALLVSSAALLAMPMAVRNVIDHGFSAADAVNVDRYFLVLMLFAVAIGLFGAARAYFVNWLGERVVADLRSAVFDHVVHMDPVFFEETRIGEVLSRLTADTTLIQSISGVNLSIVLRSSIQLIGGLALLAWTNLELMGLLLLVFPLVLAPIIVIGRWLQRLSRASQDRIADASGHAAEILGNAQTVQSFTAERLESERFLSAIERSFVVAVRRIRVRALMTTVASTAVFGALIFVLWIGAKAVLAGEISGGELGQFVLYALMVGIATGGLSEVWGDIQRASGAMERLSELLEVKSRITPPLLPKDLPEPAVGSVGFSAVTFNYPSRPNAPALADFSLQVAAGEHVAFVGSSGAGKSTVFQLLLRFYDPQMGAVLVDGVDVRDVMPQALRHRIAMVPQESVIFADTAYHNIAFSKPEASRTEVLEAARAAYAHDFIEGLPQGYDTRLGEKGARLSGGQKQRIAIARAILADPAILLLDEATSALDAESEKLVQHALNNLQSDRTTLVIAHRLATVIDADRIVVMDNGRIVDTGRHDDLVQRNPIYAGMVELQFAVEASAAGG